MRTSFLITAAFALSTSFVSAQYYSNQSAPFTLTLTSTNSTLNGAGLYACHEGAGIEGLCVGSPPSTISAAQFTFNTSTETGGDPALGTSGLLTWELRGFNFNVSSSLRLSYSPTSNVALPLFFPGEEGQTVGFDDQDKLYITGYTDDTQSPIVTYAPENFYRWYACTTYFGYTYKTLAWMVGNAVPQNPTCQKVNVLRTFV